jgi:lysylphosphatidylglycerol synthetase-like protein (DUF2156 family)
MWWSKRPARPEAFSREGSVEERLRLVLSAGGNGLSFLTLYEGWEYFHPRGYEGFVAFERHAGVAVACGDPVCLLKDQSRLIADFLAFCAANRLTPAFANASAEALAAYAAAGLNAVKVGEEPLFDTATYGPRGDRAKKVRSAANQARKNCVAIEVLPAGTRPSMSVEREIREVVGEWRRSRQVKALGFTLRLSPLALAEEKALILARHNGRLEGFLTCVPYRAGQAYYVEDLVRRPDAPNGASELLVLAAVEECRRRGATVANLGLAPLRGSRQQPQGIRGLGAVLDFTFRRLNLFYRFKPLEHFKAKFAPTAWEPAYLVYPPGKLHRAGLGLLSAFTPGKFGALTTATSRFRKPAEQPEPGFAAPFPWRGAAVTAAIGGLAATGMLLDHDFPKEALIEMTRPIAAAESLARAHLLLDSVVALLGGGWLIRSRR